MSFEISCHLIFHLVWSASVNLNLFQISIEWFRTLKPISGWMDGWVGLDGWMGWLSLYDGLLRAPTVLIKEEFKSSKVIYSNRSKVQEFKIRVQNHILVERPARERGWNGRILWAYCSSCPV